MRPFDWNCTDPVGAGDPGGAAMDTAATVVCPTAMVAGVSVMVPVEPMGGEIAMLNVALTNCEAESDTFTIKLVVPAVVGVPEITPWGDSKSPFGNADTLDKLHTYGGVPPLAVSVCEYAVPTRPAGKPVLVITKGTTTFIPKLTLAVAGATGSESCTRTVKLLVPACVGVPEITPVDLFRVSPPGSEPAVMLNV